MFNANKFICPGDHYDLNNSHVLPSLIRKFAKPKLIIWIKLSVGGVVRHRESSYMLMILLARIFALENWHPKEDDLKYMNVGTGKDISIKELATLIAKEIGFKGEIEWDISKPDGTPKQLDISRFSSLGWSPNIKLSEGIKDTIKCYLNEKSKIKI